MDMKALSKLLSMAVDDIRDALRDLHSVVEVPDKDDSWVRFLHPSFEDFVQNMARCTDGRFLVDAPAHERFMALRCMNAMCNKDKLDNWSRYYMTSYWPSHLRSGSCCGLGDDLVQELIWLISDEDALAASYKAPYANEDIIPFVRSLVEEHRPKESETLLALLRDAEPNERIASVRKKFIERCRRRGQME